MRISRLLAPRLLVPTLILAASAAPSAVRAADLETLPAGQAQEGQAEEGQAPEGQVAQQCQEDLRAFEEELANAGFGVLAPGGYAGGYAGYGTIYGGLGTPREQMQSLRDAAQVYAIKGDEEACQMVLVSMRQIYQEHDELVGIENDDPEARQTWRRAHLARAEPVSGMDRLMRADVVIGADIRSPEDEKLGEIEDVVLDPQRQTIAYVLASRGGFLGMGEDLTAVRWADLRATDDHEIFVLNTSPDAFEAAPKVERRSFADRSGEAWAGALDQYWAGVVDQP